MLEQGQVTGQVIGAAVDVHRALGPGLLESVYEACLEHELAGRGLRVERQVPIPVYYGGLKLENSYRIDLLVEEAVVVEVKSVNRLDRVHEAQLLTYLRLASRRVGLLLNFNVRVLKQGGLKRLIL